MYTNRSLNPTIINTKFMLFSLFIVGHFKKRKLLVLHKIFVLYCVCTACVFVTIYVLYYEFTNYTYLSIQLVHGPLFAYPSMDRK